MEIDLHKVHGEIEDLKHNLNSHEVGYRLLEGKCIDLEQSVSMLDERVTEFNRGQFESYQRELEDFGKELQCAIQRQGELIEEIRWLRENATSTTTALAQHKERIGYCEKSLQLQEEKIEEIVPSQPSSSQLPCNTYIVEEGDSLEKIAYRCGLTVEQIKKYNDLSGDALFTGQELKLP